MKVLAIGATGFIGSYVVTLLVDQGHEVAVLHRGQMLTVLSQGVRDIRGNRERLADCRAEIERLAPDVVLDMVLYTEAQARELVNTFRGTGCHLVGVSSADVYRNYEGFRGHAAVPPDPVPLSEDAPLRRTRYPYRGHDLPFEYAHHYEKILVEQLLMDVPELPATVLRLPAVYGPGDGHHRLQPYLARMRGGESRLLLEDGQASWRWTRGFVENVAAALALVVTDARSAGRVYNVGDEPTLTEQEWVERIASQAGWRGDVVAVPRAELPSDLRQEVDWRYHLWTDTTALRSELGYREPVPLEEALRRTVEWECSGLAGD